MAICNTLCFVFTWKSRCSLFCVNYSIWVRKKSSRSQREMWGGGNDYIVFETLLARKFNLYRRARRLLPFN